MPVIYHQDYLRVVKGSLFFKLWILNHGFLPLVGGVMMNEMKFYYLVLSIIVKLGKVSILAF